MKQRLEGEKETLGFYLSGHPADIYHQELGKLITPISHLKQSGLKKAMVCGVLNSVRRIMTKSGKRLAILTLEDATGRLDSVAFSEIFEPMQTVLVVGEAMVLEGELGQDDYTGGVKITANSLYSMACIRKRLVKYLTLTLMPEDATKLTALQQILNAFPGDTAVRMRYLNLEAQGFLTLGQAWRIGLTDLCLEQLHGLMGVERVVLDY
jgi:DNA polymerase-3 subunit alpha